MAFELNLLKPNPPSPPVNPPIPGLVFIRTVPMSFPGFNTATYSTVTIDAPTNINFIDYRSIVFRFYGIGFANATAADIRISPRRTGQVISNTIQYQINQISSTTATGWINTSTTTNIPFTQGTPAVANNPLNKLDILMHPMGYEVDYHFGSNTTLFSGGIGKSIGSYVQTATLLPPFMLRENPGLTLSLSTANFFASWNSNNLNADLPMTCDIYGYLKL